MVCHKPDGIAPFSLLGYEEVARKADFISHVVETRYMPPWKADPAFQHYKNERILSEAEITLIRDWVRHGMKKGKRSKSGGTEEMAAKPIPDLSLPMASPFPISDQGVEEFRFFSIPTDLSADVFLSGISFIPGNKRAVHHSRIMVDTTQRVRGIDGMSELDPHIKEFQTVSLADEFLYGWVPGNEGIFFPSGTGKKLQRNADLILNIHYSPSSKLQQDQSVIQLYFTKQPVEREVKTLTLRETDISNQPFFIPAGGKATFYMSYPVSQDVSLISVMPHMHFLGKTFRAFAVTPEGDMIPLIKIDDWDFNWQSTYIFKKLLKIPAGATILVEATYDNSSTNPSNPNRPVKDVGYGWNSTDEMCNLVIYYLDYKPGDEQREN